MHGRSRSALLSPSTSTVSTSENNSSSSMTTQSPSPGSPLAPSLPSFQEFLSSSLSPRDPPWPEPTRTFHSLPPFRVPSIAMRRTNESSNAQRHSSHPPMPDHSESVAPLRQHGSVGDVFVDASSHVTVLSNDGPEAKAQTFIYRRRNAPHKRNRKGSPCVECQRLKIKCTRTASGLCKPCLKSERPCYQSDDKNSRKFVPRALFDSQFSVLWDKCDTLEEMIHDVQSQCESLRRGIAIPEQQSSARA